MPNFIPKFIDKKNNFYDLQITGIVFMAVGTWIIIAYKGYSNFMSVWMFAIPALMIIVGIVVFLTSFFGCCGAAKEHHCMIITVKIIFYKYI